MTRRERALNNAEYRSLAQFRYALRQFLAFSADAARAEGLTSAQHQLLLTVRGAEADKRQPSMSDVAEHLQLKLHSTGELVARAVEAGLVERVTDPADARRVLIATTAAGRGHLERLSVLHRAELRRFRTEMNALLRAIDTPT
ncbi:MAG TPA: MarR family transcriptional regulator [Ilumatobacteraceae bacterium]|nr:MarR family transcriptional regulator [Ilumatobacteraceae bacterium]